MDKSDLVNEENADSARYSPEDKGDTSNEDSIQIGIKIAASEENSEISADIVKGDESERTMKAQDNHIDSNNENMNAFSEKQNGDTSVTTKAQPEEVVANNVAKDKIDKTISSEFIPDLNIDDTGIDNSGTNDTRDTTMGPNGVEGSPDSNKVLWTLNGSDLDNHKVGIIHWSFVYQALLGPGIAGTKRG